VIAENEFCADKTTAVGYVFAMSKAEILAEIPKLTKEERFEIRVKLAEIDNDGWLDEDDPLTAEEKKLIDARLAEHEANPQSAISFEEFKARMKEKFGR
jgi:putative addiction module component (TIGR02574 family)